MSSQEELAYITEGFNQNIRSDGRQAEELRPVVLETAQLVQASGSARLKLGDTDVLVAVKVELGTPTADRPDCGNVFFAVECSPCASPRFQGRGGDELAAEHAKALERSMYAGLSGIGGGLDLTGLCITTGKICWLVFVDALVLNIDGNVTDALSMATRAALTDLSIPSVEVEAGEDENALPELEVSDDPTSATKLDTSKVPIVLTISQVGKALAVDLTAEEELCSLAALQVAVNAAGSICSVSKRGPGGISPGILQEATHKAQWLGPQIIAAMDKYMQSSQMEVD